VLPVQLGENQSHYFIVGPRVGTDVCMHDPESMNHCECVAGGGHCCMVVVLQQCGLTLVNVCNLKFEHIETFNLYVDKEGDWHLKYVLDDPYFNKLLEDGTLVPKNVGVDS
jgi:hypothetical protein